MSRRRTVALESGGSDPGVRGRRYPCKSLRQAFQVLDRLVLAADDGSVIAAECLVTG